MVNQNITPQLIVKPKHYLILLPSKLNIYPAMKIGALHHEIAHAYLAENLHPIYGGFLVDIKDRSQDEYNLAVTTINYVLDIFVADIIYQKNSNVAKKHLKLWLGFLKYLTTNTTPQNIDARLILSIAFGLNETTRNYPELTSSYKQILDQLKKKLKNDKWFLINKFTKAVKNLPKINELTKKSRKPNYNKCLREYILKPTNRILKSLGLKVEYIDNRKFELIQLRKAKS